MVARGYWFLSAQDYIVVEKIEFIPNVSNNNSHLIMATLHQIIKCLFVLGFF